MSRKLNGKQYHSGPGGVSGVGVLDAPMEASEDGVSAHEIAEFFDLVPRPLVVMDRDHTIVYLNTAAAQTAGRSIESSIGKKFWDLFDNPDCRRGTCAAARAVQTGSICSGDAVALVQGKEMAVRVTAAPRFDQNHQVIGCVEVFHDIREELKLQHEIGRLVEASRDGQLSERGKPDQFQGAYAGIVKGVNDMLDAILLPIGEGNRILAQISTGKIDELIAQTYKGDHEKMKQAVNNVAVVLQGLQKELGRLTDASRQGQLSERGKPDQFQGAYAGIVKGVNDMLDAILLPIGEGNRILAQISTGRKDRRADCPNVQGRSRKDEAGGE
jgi:PAS domain S-box-containing protein